MIIFFIIIITFRTNRKPIDNYLQLQVPPIQPISESRVRLYFEREFALANVSHLQDNIFQSVNDGRVVLCVARIVKLIEITIQDCFYTVSYCQLFYIFFVLKSNFKLQI